MLNCLENTLKLQFDSYVTPVKFLTYRKVSNIRRIKSQNLNAARLIL